MTKDTRTTREKVLNGRSVTLLDGTQHKIRPWGIELSQDLLPLLGQLVAEIQAAGIEVSEMEIPAFFAKYSNHINTLVQLTIGYDDAQMRELTFEDSLKLTIAVCEVCIIREDGGGPLGELLRLYGVTSEIARTVLSPAIDEMMEKLPAAGKTNSGTQSRSSSRKVTRSTNSESSLPN